MTTILHTQIILYANGLYQSTFVSANIFLSMNHESLFFETLAGIFVGSLKRGERMRVDNGIYLAKTGGKTYKLIVK